MEECQARERAEDYQEAVNIINCLDENMVAWGSNTNNADDDVFDMDQQL